MNSDHKLEETLQKLKDHLAAVDHALQSDSTLPEKRAGVKEARDLLAQADELAQSALQMNQKRTEDILESIEDGLAGLDRDFNFTFLNSAATRELGYQPQDLVGKNLWDTFPHLLGTPQETVYRQVMEQRRSQTIETSAPTTGRIYDIRVYPSNEGIIVYWMDVTEQNQMERELKETEIRYRTIFEESGTCNLIIDGSGTCLMANKMACDMMGLHDGTLVGRRIYEMMPREQADLYMARNHQVIESGQGQENEVTFRTPAGEERTYLINDRCLRDASGQGVAVLSSAIDITARKQIERQLSLQADIFAAINDAVIVTDLAYHIIAWNQGAERMYGWTEAEVLGKSPGDVLHYHIDRRQRARLEESLQSGSAVTARLLEYTRDGRELMIESYTLPLRDANGAIAAYVAINRDVTGQAEWEKQLIDAKREAERNQLLLDAVIQQMPAGIVLTDASGNQARNNLEMNRIWRRKTWTIENIYTHPYQAFKPDGREYMPEEWPLSRSLRTGEAVAGEEMSILRGDGTRGVVLCSSAPVRDKGGEIIAGVVIYMDISEQKRVEFQLKESERRHRDLIQFAPAGIYEIDFRENRFLMVNDSMCKLSGYSREELLSMNPGALLDEEGRAVFAQRMKKWLANQQPDDAVEYRVKTKQGRWLNTILNVSYLLDQEGLPKGAYVIGYDITEQKQAQEALQRANQLLLEQAGELERRVRERTAELQAALASEKSLRTQLVQSEKFAALARLVGSVAHEINNPLQSVKNCLYLVQCEQLTPELDEVVAMAVSETQRMSNLVKQLRETYRPSTMQAVDFDLVELLARVSNLLAPQFRQNEIQWELHYPSDSITLHGIPDQIQQVCLNICLNAIDAINSQGNRFEITVEELAEAKQVSIAFSDNGPGVPKEQQAQIFEPFFTTKDKGTGLGLAICYEIVKNHGGDIELQSTPGQGATFIVTLPVV